MPRPSVESNSTISSNQSKQSRRIYNPIYPIEAFVDELIRCIAKRCNDLYKPIHNAILDDLRNGGNCRLIELYKEANSRIEYEAMQFPMDEQSYFGLARLIINFATLENCIKVQFATDEELDKICQNNGVLGFHARPDGIMGEDLSKYVLVPYIREVINHKLTFTEEMENAFGQQMDLAKIEHACPIGLCSKSIILRIGMRDGDDRPYTYILPRFIDGGIYYNGERLDAIGCLINDYASRMEGKCMVGVVDDHTENLEDCSEIAFDFTDVIVYKLSSAVAKFFKEVHVESLSSEELLMLMDLSHEDFCGIESLASRTPHRDAPRELLVSFVEACRYVSAQPACNYRCGTLPSMIVPKNAVSDLLYCKDCTLSGLVDYLESKDIEQHIYSEIQTHFHWDSKALKNIGLLRQAYEIYGLAQKFKGQFNGMCSFFPLRLCTQWSQTHDEFMSDIDGIDNYGNPVRFHNGRVIPANA